MKLKNHYSRPGVHKLFVKCRKINILGLWAIRSLLQRAESNHGLIQSNRCDHVLVKRHLENRCWANLDTQAELCQPLD